MLAPNQTVLHGLSQHGYRLIIGKHVTPEIRDPTSVPTSDDRVMDFFLTRVGLVKSKLVNLAGRTDRVGALAQSSLLFFPACAGMTERRRSSRMQICSNQLSLVRFLEYSLRYWRMHLC